MSTLLIDTYPDIIKQIDPSKNINIDINTLSYESTENIWWLCPSNRCGCHEYEDTTKNCTERYENNNGIICKFCTSKNFGCIHTSILLNDNMINEFAYDLNPNIDPSIIFSRSSKKIWWRCINHKSCNEHVWYTSVKLKKGCPW